jgi:hypothetical protein
MRLLIVGGAVAASLLVSGCAIKKISELPPVDQAVAAADLLMDSYNSLRRTVIDSWPNLTEEQRKKAAATLIPDLNAAKPAVLAVADAAAAWKIASADKTVDAETKYRTQKRVAENIMKDLMELWKQLKGSRE